MLTENQYSRLMCMDLHLAYEADQRAVNAAVAEIDNLRAENALLRTAGDALAKAAREGLSDIRDRSPVRPPLVAALAAWAAARGGSGTETTPESEGHP
jgi:hypothetical protein